MNFLNVNSYWQSVKSVFPNFYQSEVVAEVIASPDANKTIEELAKEFIDLKSDVQPQFVLEKTAHFIKVYQGIVVVRNPHFRKEEAKEIVEKINQLIKENVTEVRLEFFQSPEANKNNKEKIKAFLSSFFENLKSNAKIEISGDALFSIDHNLKHAKLTIKEASNLKLVDINLTIEALKQNSTVEIVSCEELQMIRSNALNLRIVNCDNLVSNKEYRYQNVDKDYEVTQHQNFEGGRTYVDSIIYPEILVKQKLAEKEHAYMLYLAENIDNESGVLPFSEFN